MNLRSGKAWCPHCVRTADNAGMLDWLRDPRSLTARLQARGSFSLAVLGQGLCVPNVDETSFLGLSPGRRAWVREVALSCDGKPVVFAHTVLPCRPRGPMSEWLARLGTRSLGALLFSHPGFKRGVINSTRLDHRHPLFQPAVSAMKLGSSPPASLWARRSHFTFEKQSVLVTEVFSPHLAEKIQAKENNSRHPTNKPI